MWRLFNSFNKLICVASLFPAFWYFYIYCHLQNIDAVLENCVLVYFMTDLLRFLARPKAKADGPLKDNYRAIM